MVSNPAYSVHTWRNSKSRPFDQSFTLISVRIPANSDEVGHFTGIRNTHRYVRLATAVPCLSNIREHQANLVK